MVRPLMTDVVFLAQKALPADAGDLSVADDLLDTLTAHKALRDVQSGHRLPQGSLPHRGGLSFSAVAAQGAAPQDYQGPVAGPCNADPCKEFHRLDCPDHPA